MSQAGEEEEGDENEECFHESLDGLLSSSNTSCSCSTSSSEPEEDHDPNLPNYDEPAPVRNYDVWNSDPTSVEERRFLLLRQMGLNGDPPILRHRSSLSLSSNHLNLLSEKSYIFKHSNSGDCVDYDHGIRISGIIRSKSDGDCDSCKTSDVKNSVAGVRGITVKSDSASFMQNYSHTERSSTLSPNKPPKGKLKMDCTRNGSCSSLLAVLGNGVGEGVECNGATDINEVCMIKNLDNGKKFVVNEVRGDGMWEKIKEVGTGRQLTMEEFSSEMCVGTSPIVQELMRRQNVEDGNREGLDPNADGSYGNTSKSKKKGNWLRSIKNAANSVVWHKEKRSSDEKDSSSEKDRRRSSSATDDSQDVSFHGPEKIRVRQYGKSVKELSALYKTQELQAHKGSIWTIKFSLNGKYLASAGEDCVILVWEIVETERKGDFSFDKPEDGNLNILFVHKGSPEPLSPSPNLDDHWKTKKRGRYSICRKSSSLEQILVPETVFALSEKPICSLQGHLSDVLDLSWSKSQQLLSSSMDKTVRLWDLSRKSCLKIFSHSDFVTCIQFNPVDDRYFISGSLDAKVRIWSIPNRQVVDWSDFHEMVTAACYTPDGKGALVGSYKGSCIYTTHQKIKCSRKTRSICRTRKRNLIRRKLLVSSFMAQFAPGSTSEVLITTADSRIRVLEGVDIVRKFKGFRNTNSQISASLTSKGEYVISASEDSYVYVWRHDGDSQPNRSKGVTETRSYEFFHCPDVSVAIPWTGMPDTWEIHDSCAGMQNSAVDHFEISTAKHPTTPVEETNGSESSPSASGCSVNSPFNGTLSSVMNSSLFDRIPVTWVEEKPSSASKSHGPHVSGDFSTGFTQSRSAWGMVIVTAGLGGEIKTFQNFGLPAGHK